MLILRAVAVAFLSTAILLPVAASAKVVDLADPGKSDVWVRTWVADDGNGHWDWQSAGSPTNSDIFRPKLSHGEKTISLKVDYADLDKSSPIRPNILTMLKLGPQKLVAWWVWIDEDGTLYRKLVRATHDFDWARGGDIKCDGLSGKFHWGTDTLTSSFPRSCIGDPKSFKYRIQAIAQDKNYPNPDDPIYFDYADTADHALNFSKALSAG